jgi:Polyketide cyclase / dehydrase and lipid transport
MSDPIFSHDHSVEVNATPEKVYDTLSDLGRASEWSPMSVGGEWLDGGTGQVGDWFEGQNRAGKMEWKAKVEITEADRPERFGFWTMGQQANVVHWSYSIEPAGSGAKLTQHYRLYNAPESIAKSPGGVEAWCEAVQGNMQRSCDGIKAVAEQGA